MEKRDFLKMCTAMAAPAVLLTACDSEQAAATAETSFERMNRTRTIRASYASYAPAMVVDPNTGQKSGIFFDLMNLIGQQLDMKIEWGEEVGFGEIAQGLKSRRYDICAANVWPTAARATRGNFTMPSYFSAACAYVRSDETKIKSYDDINQSHIRIAVEDGDGILDIARGAFPNAKIVALPQGATQQRLMNVANGKADVTFDDAYYAQLFIDANPGAVKRLSAEPLQVFANTMMFDNDDWRTKVVFDTALSSLHNTGAIERLVEKHTGRTDTFLLLAKPYEQRN